MNGPLRTHLALLRRFSFPLLLLLAVVVSCQAVDIGEKRLLERHDTLLLFRSFAVFFRLAGDVLAHFFELCFAMGRCTLDIAMEKSNRIARSTQSNLSEFVWKQLAYSDEMILQWSLIIQKRKYIDYSVTCRRLYTCFTAVLVTIHAAPFVCLYSQTLMNTVDQTVVPLWLG